MKTRLLFFLIVSCVLLRKDAVAQDRKIVAHVVMDTRAEQADQIAYKKGLRLKWNDFQGAEDPNNSDAVAMAYTGVSVRYDGSVSKGTVHLNIRVLTHFSRSQSWVLSGSKNDWTLNHEQRHFDITALNACALYRELSSYAFTDRFETEIRELQERYQRKNEEDQDRYDRETNHGIRHKAQDEWTERIQRALDESGACYP